MQAVKDAIPGFEQDLRAHLFNHNSPERHTSRNLSVNTGIRDASSLDASGTHRAASRDENSTPNLHSSAEHKFAHSEAAPRVDQVEAPAAVANGGGGGDSARGVSAMTMSDVERMKVTSERIERLLASVNNNPRNCGPALVQLKSAVRALPEEVWQVLLSTP